MLVDISDIRKDLNEEEKEIFDKVVKYITVAKKLVKDDKNINKKLLSIRLKIANKENKAYGE